MALPSGTYNTKYEQDMAIVRTNLQWLLTGVFLILLFVIPLFVHGALLRFIIYVSVTCIAAHGLNILTGYCGQLSLGQAGFIAVGAYAYAILVSRVGFPFWIALPCAGVIAGLTGAVFGLPSLRIKGYYLALATLASQFIIFYIITHAKGLTGGTLGLFVPEARLGMISFDSVEKVYYVIMGAAVVMTIVAKNLVRTRTGRAFIAIRDNEIAAEITGINLYFYKAIAFFIGCFFAGVAGGLWVLYAGLAHPEMFTLMDSVWYLGIIVIGGLGSVTGSIFGSFFVRGLGEVATRSCTPIKELFPLFGAQITSSITLIIFGIILMLFLVFEPRGLAHRWEVMKTRARLYPFSYEAIE
jgi:branched-chain amino acid transport system permease protein